MLDDCAFFDVSTAADLYWCGRKDYYDLNDDWGPLRPPYPHMWLEWKIPEKIMLDGEMVTLRDMHMDGVRGTDLCETRYGALISTLEGAQGMESDNWRAEKGVVRRKDGGRMPFATDKDEIFPLGVIEVIQRPEGTLYINPMLDIICVDTQTGQYIKDSRRSEGDHRCMATGREWEPDAFSRLQYPDNNVVWMALQLLNCRNVVAQPRNNALTRTTREKRQRVPAKTYHTIVLPGMTKRYDSYGRRNTTADEATMASHRVRGHFKTYTAEAPLMGQHVGTWWWGWNMRGSKERGEVVSDYKMEV